MNNKFWMLMIIGLGWGFFTFQASAQPVISGPPLNQTVVWGGNATFDVLATGVGPLTYQWRLNGTNLPNNLITTVAGGNLFNNQPATNTLLSSPQGSAMDSFGNLYVADTDNNVIRKLDTNGVMTIVAGNGCTSFSGDGGPATNAGLYLPGQIALDTNRNLYIADSGNDRIRKVDTNGVITTYAGNGTNYMPLGDNGQATNAALLFPTGVAVDGTGNLFIADNYHHCIRKVSTTGIITTVAGNYFGGMGGYSGDGNLATSAKLNFPSSVAVDASSNIFIADTYNYRIRKVNAAGIISTISGTGSSGYSGDDGLATAARVGYVYGLRQR